MHPLHRHQLAWLSDAGWQRVLTGGWDAQARECLAHWAQQRLPLVVTRQRAQGESGGADSYCSRSDGGGHGHHHGGGHAHRELVVSLGLPAPGRWGRRRLALAVGATEIERFDAFPAVSDLPQLLPAPARNAWRALCAALSACGARSRVYGSHGWQLLTGLDHLRPGSDIDLCIGVDGPAQADAVATLLHAWPDGALRLDGELVFHDGSAVAWREWAAWRAGRTPSVLVKRLDVVALAQAPFWQAIEAA